MTRCKPGLLAGILMFLSVLLLGFSTARVLPPAAGDSFSHVVALINSSARLGPTIRVTGVAIAQSQVRLSLQLNEHDAPVTVALTHPSLSDGGVRSRWFALSTSSDKLTESHLRLLAAVLDEVFPTDPFIAPDGSDKPPFEYRKQALTEGVSKEKGILGRGQAVALVLLLIAATAGTAWQLLIRRPAADASAARDSARE